MSYQVAEQLKHDRINLFRIVKNLEPIVFSDAFLPRGGDRKALYIKATSTQATIKYAQDLLEKVKEPAVSGSYDDLKRRLDKMQATLQEARENLEPQPVRPKSILATLKLPTPAPTPLKVEEDIPPPIPEEELLPAEDETPMSPLGRPPEYSFRDIAAPPVESIPNSTGVDPPDKFPEQPLSPLRPNTQQPNPMFLTASLQTQEELSAQLAQMGHQLKLNAIHLSNSLAKEKGTVEDATEKLDKNLGTMTKERVRLRDHSSKSSSTTWLVLGAILCVIVAWIVMFFVIRVT